MLPVEINKLVPKEQLRLVMLFCKPPPTKYLIAFSFTLNLRQIKKIEAESQTKMLLRPSMAQVHLIPLLGID